MAGRERSGAVSGRHDLFDGRAWVLTPTPETDPGVDGARHGPGPVGRRRGEHADAPERHDAAVAAVSHVPQLAASLVAARLEPLDDAAVALAGQGLRDVTRIAASDPGLWTQILAGNASRGPRPC
jgi:prephenate dehydrogenase